jgi:hypothetical protein
MKTHNWRNIAIALIYRESKRVIAVNVNLLPKGLSPMSRRSEGNQVRECNGLGMRIGQRPKQDAVHHRKDSCIGADPKASVSTATAVKPGLLRSWRRA